ncbi:MAG: hypothetical protein ACREH4_08070 [Vitreimonas sp.]
MRFALVATSAVALAAVPLALSVSGPQMSGEQFLTAVRCVAYHDVTRADAELRDVKMQLNAEARHQPADTAAEAQAEVDAIARQAVNTDSLFDAAMIRADRAQACASARVAEGQAVANAA